MSHDTPDTVGPLVVVPLHNEPPAPLQTPPLELIPMDTTPRRAAAPPCRKPRQEPCNLATFLMIVASALLVCAGAIAALSWAAGEALQLVDQAIDASLNAARALMVRR